MACRAVVALALLAAGCGAERPVAAGGIGPAWQLGQVVRDGAPVAALRCTRAPAPTAVHVELFARGHVVIVPAGIGIAAPRSRAGAYVSGGRCRYPLWTSEPTGLVRVGRPGLTLGDLFAVWGQPLARGRLGRWRAAVTAHVDGVRWRGDPRAIPLRRHAQIVLQAGAPVLRPHARYAFPAGL